MHRNRLGLRCHRCRRCSGVDTRGSHLGTFRAPVEEQLAILIQMVSGTPWVTARADVFAMDIGQAQFDHVRLRF